MTRVGFWQAAFVAALGRMDRPFSLVGGADFYGPRGTEIRVDKPRTNGVDSVLVRVSAETADMALAAYDERFTDLTSGDGEPRPRHTGPRSLLARTRAALSPSHAVNAWTVAAKLGDHPIDSVRTALSKLVARGEAERVDVGMYKAVV